MNYSILINFQTATVNVPSTPLPHRKENDDARNCKDPY